MALPINRNLKSFARALRKNMTDAEHALWSKLRRKQLNDLIFYRQRNIGNYIVDFYCPAAKLIVELDGGRHYSVEGRAKDDIRDAYMVNLCLNVLRFSDLDVLKHMDGVLSVLYEHTKIPPTPF